MASKHSASWLESSGPAASRQAPRLRLAIAVWVAGLAFAGVGCSSGDGGGSGSGGNAGHGSGGTTAKGGAGGSGGSSATGGSGSGGVTGSGGSVATGGTSATGGGSGSGSGGTVATGGSKATGGATGTGGQGTGGTSSSGGKAGGDGGTGTGGATATGGAGGGRSGTGGAATGGNATGGTGSGGIQGTGGTRADGGPDVGTDAGGDTGGDTGTTWSPCPTTAGTACVVLPLGDSITEGCCTAPMGGYRIELFRQATKNGKNITFVGSLTNGPSTVDGKTFPQKHEGHGGYTIDTDSGHSGISGTITQNALSSGKPHIVLLMIGTNDINGNVDTANAPTRLGKLIDDITTRAPSALLVVASIIPSKNDGTNSNFQKYNAAIPGLIDTRAKAGKHVVFLDNYKAFSADTSYKTTLLADNLHPNTAGYVVLGQAWYGVIGSLLPAAP